MPFILIFHPHSRATVCETSTFPVVLSFVLCPVLVTSGTSFFLRISGVPIRMAPSGYRDSAIPGYRFPQNHHFSAHLFAYIKKKQ